MTVVPMTAQRMQHDQLSGSGVVERDLQWGEQNLVKARCVGEAAGVEKFGNVSFVCEYRNRRIELTRRHLIG